jgi:hypothetical protein
MLIFHIELYLPIVVSDNFMIPEYWKAAKSCIMKEKWFVSS